MSNAPYIHPRHDSILELSRTFLNASDKVLKYVMVFRKVNSKQLMIMAHFKCALKTDIPVQYRPLKNFMVQDSFRINGASRGDLTVYNTIFFH